MAITNIQMKPPGNNHDDVDHPETNSGQVLMDEQGTTLATAFSGHIGTASSTSGAGHVQLATSAEVTTGTNDSKAVTPAGVKVELDKKVPTTRTINTKALSANITLAYADVTPEITALTANTTLALTHAGKVLTMSHTSARTITIPTNASVAFPIGTEIAIININTGALTIAAASGVTLQSEGSKTKITKQYTSAALKKTATDTWILVGNISA